jgi:predicted GNAT family N-acyltransferase
MPWHNATALRYNPHVTKYTCQLVKTSTDLERVLEVRRAVFVTEQGVDPRIEYDGLDDAALQLIVSHDGLVVGTARVRFPEPGTAKIERMAVLKAYRRYGVGREILSFLTDVLKERSVATIVLHAQYPVVGFYESAGYHVTGDPFFEAGIKHVEMRRHLS